MCSACRAPGASIMVECRIFLPLLGAIHRVGGRRCRYRLDCRRGPPMTSDAASYHTWLSVCNTAAKRMQCACRQSSLLSCHSFEMAVFLSNSFSFHYHIGRELPPRLGLGTPTVLCGLPRGKPKVVQAPHLAGISER
ncbi:hypothetical protein KVT40_003368 [Elsinoe batatas]|uniref:Uncharacterized protein n=1 Tax=Elsinoe batatas TaxID=2601811 RepID=A0A8K0PJG5_9PEZI|nr:hypothetical protein KVT40_003368 [Elsinoe batatas]